MADSGARPGGARPSGVEPTARDADLYDQDGDDPDLDYWEDGSHQHGDYREAHYRDGDYQGDEYQDDEYQDDEYQDDEYQDDEYHDGGHADDGAGAGDRRGSTALRRRRSVRHRHPILAGFIAVLLVLILLAGSGVLWAAHQIYPSGHSGPDVLVTIPPGASSAQIGAELAKVGVIHAGSLFRYYFKVEGGSPLLSGTYILAKNESYDQVIATLRAGPVVITDKLVIPEGFTLRQIAYRIAALPGMHLSAPRFLALSSSGSVRSPLEPANIDDLEGLVYPATYTLRRTDTESTILEELVGTFDQQTRSLGLTAGAARLHMTPYQVITVASIIQGEAKFHKQFPDVASVIYNRLHSHMTLGTDSTLIYALRQANPNLVVAKVKFGTKSPYNTRLHQGLPPTPIDNPSIQAIAAAIAPAHTTLRYFVAIDSSGNLAFATTDAGFAQLVTRCRANHLC